MPQLNSPRLRDGLEPILAIHGITMERFDHLMSLRKRFGISMEKFGEELTDDDRIFERHTVARWIKQYKKEHSNGQ